MFKYLKDKRFYKKKSVRFTLIGVLGLLGIGLVWFGVSVTMGQSSFVEVVMNVMPSRTNPRTVLVLGSDATPGTRRTDTMIVFHIDPNSGQIGMLSIPRDSRVEIPDHGLDKINHAFAYGGANLSVQTVSQFLNVPIDNYLHVDLAVVAKIIDVIGGVEIDVPKNMHYIDRAGDLYINFKKGMQHMTGADAIAYLRFRHDMTGDIGRVERQQAFIRAVIAKVLTAGNLMRSPILISELVQSIDTNLSAGEVIALLMKFSSASKNGQLVSGMINGGSETIGGVSYWIPDQNQVKTTVSEILLGQGSVSGNAAAVLPPFQPELAKDMSDDGDVVNNTIVDVGKIRTKVNVTPSVMAKTQMEMLSDDRLAGCKSPSQVYSIEVLNGSGIVGLARELADSLHPLPLQVTCANAAKTDHEKTVLVDWKGNSTLVLSLASLLNIDPGQIIVYDKSNNLLDATILVGRDWMALRKKINIHGI